MTAPLMFQARTSAGRYYFMAANLEEAAWHGFALSKELGATLIDVLEVDDKQETVLSK